MSDVKTALLPPMPQGAKPTPTEEAVLLRGLSRLCWAAKLLFKESLKDEDGNWIDGTFLYPPGPGQEPIPHYLIGLDSGKRAEKIAGVDEFHNFSVSTLPNAYCAARAIHIEETRKPGKKEQKFYSWKRLAPAKEGEQQETFWAFEQALPFTDDFTVGDSHIRLRERRVKNFNYAGLIYQLKEMGCSPTEEITHKGGKTQIVPKIHYVCLALGLPYQDVNEMTSPLREAIEAMKGPFTMEVTDLRTGIVEVWMCHISAIYPVGQARGTYLACTTKLNGDPAIEETLVTVTDGGGGDAYDYSFDLGGELTTIGERRGNGSVDIATELRNLIRKELHLTKFTLIQAQEALYTGYVRKAGNAEFPIPDLINKVKPRFENMVTRLEPTEQAVDTLQIYAGGLAALLDDELEAMLGPEGKNLMPGRDYIITPKEIAAVLNAVGLFVYVYLRVRDEAFGWAEEFLDLQEQLLADRKQLNFLRRSNLPADDPQIIEAAQTVETHKAVLAIHPAHYYPDYVDAIKIERAAAEEAKSAS